MLKRKIIGQSLETGAFSNLRGYDYLLVDMHHLIFRSYFAVKLSNSSGEPTQIYHLALKMLYDIIFEMRPKGVLLCWDDPQSWRKVVNPSYKATRKKRDPGFFIPFRRLYWLCEDLGFEQVMSHGFEADDWLAYVCATRKQQSILILSGDKDLFQLINDTTKHHIAYPNKKGRGCDIVDEKASERMLCAPKHVAYFKSIAGDPADNVKGVPGVGLLSVKRFFEDVGDPTPYIEDGEPYYTDDKKLTRIFKKIQDNIEGIRADWNIVDLSHDHSPVGYDLFHISFPDSMYRVGCINEFFVVNGLKYLKGIRENLQTMLKQLEVVCPEVEK